MAKAFSPMKAVNEEYDLASQVLTRFKLSEFIISPKEDGIRCTLHFFGARSSKSKPFPNKELNRILNRLASVLRSQDVLDGELTLTGKTFHQIQGTIMSHDGDLTGLTYTVFDYVDVTGRWAPAVQRNIQREACLERVEYVIGAESLPITVRSTALLEYTTDNVGYLDNLHKQIVAKGVEGLMLRHKDSPYKYGRSTLKEAYLLKYVAYERITCKIVDLNEAQENLDTSCKKQENLVGKNTLGSFTVTCEEKFPGRTFNVGSGFSAAQAVEFWKQGTSLHGKHIEVKYKPHGTKDVPRQPVFVGLRPELD